MLTRVSIRPKVPMSPRQDGLQWMEPTDHPATARTAGSDPGAIFRAVAATAQPCWRYPSTIPAPMPWDPPVTMATLRSVPPLTGQEGLTGVIRDETRAGPLRRAPHTERHRKQDRFECSPVVGLEQPDGAPFPWCQRRPPQPEEVPLRGELFEWAASPGPDIIHGRIGRPCGDMRRHGDQKLHGRVDRQLAMIGSMPPDVDPVAISRCRTFRAPTKISEKVGNG